MVELERSLGPEVVATPTMLTDLIEQLPAAESREVSTHPIRGRRATGLDDLDRLGGLHAGLVTLLCGTSGAGTTSLAFGIALNIASQDTGVTLFVSDHLSGTSLSLRALANIARVDLWKVAREEHALTDEERLRLRSATADSKSRRLAVLADPGVWSAVRIDRAARQVQRTHGSIAAIVVDRFTPVSSQIDDPGMRRSHTRRAAAEASELAAHYDCPVLVTERPVRGRGQAEVVQPITGWSPHFCYFDQPGAFWFLHRAEQWNADSPAVGIAELHVPWFRDGPTGVCRLAFLNHLTRVANLSRKPG